MVIIVFLYSLMCCQLANAWYYGNSIACSTPLKHCYIILSQKDEGIGIFSVPKLVSGRCCGNIVYEEHVPLYVAKFEAIKLKLKNPKKHYKLFFHY